MADKDKESPIQAEVYIDGVKTGTTPFEKEINFGEYDILVKYEGAESFEKSVEVNEVNPPQIIATLKKIQKPVIKLVKPEKKHEKREDIVAAGWWLTGIGGGLAIGGGVSLFLFNDFKKKAASSKKTTNLRDYNKKAKDSQTAGIILAGTGAASLTTGIILLLITDAPKRKSKFLGIFDLQITPNIEPYAKGGGLLLQGEF